MLFGIGGRKRFGDLTEQEIIALAISAEEDDSRIYLTFAEQLSSEFPGSAKLFRAMAQEEETHRQKLIDRHKASFGETIPLIRREHVAGFYGRKPIWLTQNLTPTAMRDEAVAMERQARAFYLQAASNTPDADTRKLLGELALAEEHHADQWHNFEEETLTPQVRSEEDQAAHRQLLLTWVQPGLAGLMDGSVSTLAPIFAAAFATGDTWQTFLVGLAASIGAGISMGFTEAASDDGVISGRGSPLKRGIASGVMTTIGGLGHALPYLIPDFNTATTLAIIIVFIELWAIAWIQNRYMDTPFFRAAIQVVLGGALVFAAGILIGNA